MTAVPAAANQATQLTGPGDIDVQVSTWCDDGIKNLTGIQLYSRGNQPLNATLTVGDTEHKMSLYPGRIQRHKFPTTQDNAVVTFVARGPSGTGTTSMTSDCRRDLAVPLPPPEGYWLLSANGFVYDFGMAGRYGGAFFDVVDIESTPSGLGYYITAQSAFGSPTGHVTDSGDAKPFGVLPAPPQGHSVVSTSVTPSGNGLWRFTDKGGVLVAGDAGYFGDMTANRLNGPVLDSKATPSGNGYWFIASDGGVFSFGDAKFYGSMGGQRLNAPVVGMAPDPDGVGYWLVAADGGVFAFEAPFRGSMGGKALNKPVIGAIAYGDGYLMVASDGGVFNFSSKPFVGSLGSQPAGSPIIDIAAMPTR